MGFAPFDRAPRNVGTGLPAKFAGRKMPKTSRHKIAKRYGSSIFLETKQVAAPRPFFCERAASRNGFVSEDGSDRVGAATVPRNESQQFRPAGTRVALPGTNAAHRIARVAFAGRFVLRFFSARR